MQNLCGLRECDQDGMCRSFLVTVAVMIFFVVGCACIVRCQRAIRKTRATQQTGDVFKRQLSLGAFIP